MICHLSLGINVSILLILLIFGVFFSLPLKLLLDTNYGNAAAGETNEDEKNDGVLTAIKISVDYRSLKLCENFEYKSALKSVFFDSHDGNCTHVKRENNKKAPKVDSRKSKIRSMAENLEESEKNLNTNNKKSLSIAGHILAVMLIGSAVAALVEVLRARFFAVKEQRPDGCNSSAGRRPSLIDFAQKRQVRKDTIQAQKSFEIQGMMHRSPFRPIAARPPPLLRRSSFPALILNKKDIPALTAAGPGAHGRISRRPSFAVDSDEECNSFADFRRHSRLIRRH